MNEPINEQGTDSSSMVKLVYILYLASIVVGLTGLIGVIVAYVNKNESAPWLQSHYQFQIRTFWIGVLFTFIGILTTFILIGFLILFFVVIWMIIRCVKGLQTLDKQQAHPNPTTWLF
ncbi:hypothetical protein KJ365_10115 [Glaciecola sp. XM2]|jgi:uncharacterized membrane protein|uniref:DUF4870 family protein n=1 Tax=Glaciecola sp. XM2 TaxID=1914931 RepID=UPI001BDE99A0|nr:DUF4870 domain-containing protein [Glaciecola sp. XM2]MBT1451229.1 hypothetical protein [Glaciecola sp. XM2]